MCVCGVFVFVFLIRNRRFETKIFLKFTTATLLLGKCIRGPQRLKCVSIKPQTGAADENKLDGNKEEHLKAKPGTFLHPLSIRKLSPLEMYTKGLKPVQV